MDRIFAQIKPDTLSFWENMFNVRRCIPFDRMPFSPYPKEQLSERDYRRVQPLVNWILSLPLEFHGDSAFASKFRGHYVSSISDPRTAQ